MPLEFPCPKCQHLLRTADDKAGLSATCPACGESIWVPYPHEIGATDDRHQPPEPDAGPSSDRYELEDPFADETLAKPRDVAADDPFAVETPHAGQHDADSISPEPSRAENVVADHAPGMRTCEHCGTENEPQARQCRACAADLPMVPQAAPHDGWQPRDPDVGEIMKSSWGIYTSEMGLLIGGWLLWIVMIIAAGFCSMIPLGIMLAIFGAAGGDLIWLGVVSGILLSLPLLVLGIAILTIGFIHFCFNVARGTSAGVSDLFFGFGEGRTLIPGALVVALVTLLANVPTCGLAAIILWPLWYAQVFRRSTAGEALGAGFQVIQREFVTVLVVGLIVTGIFLAVNMLPYIGVIVMVFAMPFLEMLHAVAYLRMERERIAADRAD